MLGGRFVSISGSAGDEADRGELRRCHAVVAELTKLIIERGGGIIECVGKDPRINGADPASAQTFFWTIASTILEAIDGSTSAKHRVLLRAVCNLDKVAEQVPQHQQELWARLKKRNVLELLPTEAGIHIGGEIRGLQTRNMDAAVLIGGGKGTWHIGRLGLAEGVPVIALDTGIGSTQADGKGSLAHHLEAVRNPQKYMPGRGQQLARLLGTLSVRPSDSDPTRIARTLADLLDSAEYPAPKHIDAIILTVVPVELQAARELLRLGSSSANAETKSGTIVQISTAIGVTCIGCAGNSNAAAVTTDLLTTFTPKVALLAGIGGGDPGSTQLGDVVIANQVIGYEPAAILGDAEPESAPRPVVIPADHKARQRLCQYLAGDVCARVRRRFKLTKFAIKCDPIASGEKLVRNEGFLQELKAQHHQKIRAVDMEAVGFVQACQLASVPCFVVRGISDHADANKSDEPQHAAARNALAVAIDLCEFALQQP